jgi:hypothetical protein
MGAWAGVADIEQRWPVPPGQAFVVDELIDEAEHRLTLAAGDLAARVAAGRCTADAIRYAVRDMVIRVLRNPTGLRSQTVGPFSQTFDATTASARMRVTRDERALLGLPSGKSGSVPLGDPALANLFRSPDRFGGWRSVGGS